MSRSDSFSLRGRLPTWVVRMRSRLKIMKRYSCSFVIPPLCSAPQHRTQCPTHGKAEIDPPDPPVTPRKYPALFSILFGGHNTHSLGRGNNDGRGSALGNIGCRPGGSSPT